MNEDSKMILEQLSLINTNVLMMKEDIAGLKSDVLELKGDVSELKGDVSTLKADVSTLKADVSVLKTDMEEVKGRVTKLEDGQRNLYALVENEISKKITIVGEGHFFVMKALNELRGFQEEKEMMDLKILDLQIDMKKVKKHLQIA